MLKSAISQFHGWLISVDMRIVILVIGIAGLLFQFVLRRRQKGKGRRHQAFRKDRRHSKNVDAADRLLAGLRCRKGEHLVPRMIAYLRKIDPHMFEELILSALEAQGTEIKRNRRYSSDGGVDGRFYIDGHLYLIQAKRYQGRIDPAHIQMFSEAIGTHDAAGGLFVHTGRTSSRAYLNLALDPRITLFSGRDLVRLIQGNPLELFEDSGGF